MTAVLRGALAAAVTPLRDGRLDVRTRSAPYVDFLVGHGVDGLLALGTTGEGVMFPPAHRSEIARGVRRGGGAAGSRSPCTSARRRRTTPSRSRARAAETGADAVAVIAPPYFALDEEELLAHFAAAAAACAPVPFYLYEFEARSGYAIPVAVVERLRERAPNLAGLKVSDSPWDKVAPYLLEGLDVFVGAEGAARRGPGGRRCGRGLRARGELPGRGRPARARAVAGAGGEGRARCAPRSAGFRSTLRRRPRSGCAASRSPPRCCAPLRGLTRRGAGRARADRARLAGVSALRSLILAAADSPRLQRFVQRYGFRLGAARFVAGESLDDGGPGPAAAERAGSPHEHDAARRGRPRRGPDARGRRRLPRAARPHPDRGPAHERRAQAHAPRPLDRRGARAAQRRRARRARRGPTELRPHRHGGVAPRRRHAPHLPPPARERARERRHRPAVVPLPHRERPRGAAPARARTCASSRAPTSSRRRSPTRASATSTPRMSGCWRRRSAPTASPRSRPTTRR